MTRTPVNETVPTPRCLGLSFNRKDPTCNRCPVRERCELVCLRWAPRASLTESVQRLEAKLAAPVTATFNETYAAAYLKHYGTNVSKHVMRGVMFTRAAVRTEELCTTERLDVETWINAQMHGMAKFIRAQKASGGRCKMFMPNMLCGPRARVRFNVYVRMSGKFYNRSTGDAFDSDTESEKLVRELTLAEDDVGSLIVAGSIKGQPVTFAEAIDRCAMRDTTWAALIGSGSEVERVKTARRFDSKFLAAAIELARVRAAVLVAGRVDPALPDSIGYEAPFCWESFAKVVARVVRRIEPVKVSGELADCQWRGVA